MYLQKTKNKLHICFEKDALWKRMPWKRKFLKNLGKNAKKIVEDQKFGEQDPRNLTE